MTFEVFINNIINSFNAVFPHIASYINSLINNNFIKLIIYLSLSAFLINLVFSILNIVYSILNNNHDKEETIKLFGNKSSETSKNGGNIKSKDIYW